MGHPCLLWAREREKAFRCSNPDRQRKFSRRSSVHGKHGCSRSSLYFSFNACPNTCLIKILFTFAALKFPKQNRLKVFKKVIKMIDLKILESAVLLRLVNHKIVAQNFIKLYVIYKARRKAYRNPLASFTPDAKNGDWKIAVFCFNAAARLR